MQISIDDLSPTQQLAGLLRILATHGYDDKLAGHVSIAGTGAHEGTYYVNPLGVFWKRVSARDVVRVDRDGEVVEGSGAVNPTILFHTELHRARPDIAVAIHNHPPYGTIWAAAGEVPPVIDQTGANAGGKVVLYREYPGAVLTREIAATQAAAYGDADIAILAKHGTLVTAEHVGHGLARALTFEWRCRKAYEVAAMSRKAEPIDEDIQEGLAQFGAQYGNLLFDAYLQDELERDPSLLD